MIKTVQETNHTIVLIEKKYLRNKINLFIGNVSQLTL